MIDKKKIIIISEEIAGYAKPFAGQGVVIYEIINRFKNRYKIKVLTIGFKGYPEREDIEGVEVIRFTTPLTDNCESFQEMFSRYPRDIDKLNYYFKDEVLRYFKSYIKELQKGIVYIHHTCGEGLLCNPLKKMGFKITIVFHWLRFQVYLRSLFSDKYIDLSYDYNSLGLCLQYMLPFIKNIKIWKDEKAFMRFILLFYRMHIPYLLPSKIRFYFESEIEPLHYADNIFALGLDMKSYISWLSPYKIYDKLNTITYGIGEEYFNPSNNELVCKMSTKLDLKRDEIFLFIGRISPMKGLEYLIRSMYYVEEVISLNERIIFLIVGEAFGVHKDYLERLIVMSKELKRIKVIFTGPIYGQEKIALYDLSDVFILPSVYETFGLVILEAMARGKPAIVSNFCDSAKIVKDDFGIVVDYDDPSRRAKNLGEAIIKILGMDLGVMGVAAREEAEKHRWDNIAMEYQEIYNLL